MSHSASVTIVNRKGLHARASAKFVKCAETFEAEVKVTRDGQSVGGTSIMGLMMLAAGPGTSILIEAEGADATQALANLAEGIQGLVHHMRNEQQMIRDWVDAQAEQHRDMKKVLERLAREHERN